MDFYDEVKKVATELYEITGRVEGRDLDNWLDAERIVAAQYKEHEKLGQKKQALKEKLKKHLKK